MYRCILVPLDGSPFGEAALPLAASIARASNSLLRLAHVYVPLVPASGVESIAFGGHWFEGTKDQTRSYLDGVAGRLREEYDIEVRTSILDGAVGMSLEQHAWDCGAQLVVLRTHGHVRVRRLWHQGIAEHLNRRLDVPVLMVHQAEDEAEPVPARGRPPHILVALDREPACDLVLEQAVALASTLDARLTLLTVSSHAADPFGVESTAFVERAAEGVRARGLDCHPQVRVADEPSVAIVEFLRARQLGPDAFDLAALGQPRDPGVLSRLFTVTTPEEVLLETGVPVLFCRRPLLGAPPEQLIPLPAS